MDKTTVDHAPQPAGNPSRKILYTIVAGAIVGAILAQFIGGAPGAALGAMLVTLLMRPVQAKPGSMKHLWQTFAVLAAAMLLSIPLRIVVFHIVGLFKGGA